MLHSLFWTFVASFPLLASTFPIQITELMYNPPGGDEFEFIEITNSGTTAVDLSLSTWEGIEYRFGAGSLIQPNDIWILASNDAPERFAEAYPGITPRGYYGKKLANGGERITLRNAVGQPIAWIEYEDDGFWPTEADGQGYSLERLPAALDGSSPSAWRRSVRIGGSPGAPTTLVESPSIRLTEIYAASSSTAPDDIDFVELSNQTDSELDLSGWSLSDSENNPTRFIFPPGTRLSRDEVLVVLFSPVAIPANLTAPFGLRQAGETLFLYDATTQPVDAVRYGPQVPGFSMSRTENNWELSVPTPGAPAETVQTGEPSTLLINEWKADADDDDGDWIELYNPHPVLAVSLNGLCLGYGALTDLPSEEIVVAPFGAEWQIFRATESPTPDDFRAWTRPDFQPTTWETLFAPFYVGANPGSGTELLDMPGQYTSLLMRREFTVADLERFLTFSVRPRTDDGFIARFNGSEWGRLNAPRGVDAFDLVATKDENGDVTEWDFDLDNFALFLNEGVNTIAVHAVSSELNDDDFYIDFSLVGILPPETAFRFIEAAPLPALSFVPPQGFLLLRASEGNDITDLPFRLPASGSTLALTSPTGEALDRQTYTTASEGVSQGRFPDGGTELRFFTNGSTPGASNLADRDGDGIPDQDETLFGLDPDDPTDALVDLDGDGRSNLEEILSGTDPRDAMSVFSIQLQSISADGQLTIVVPRLPNRTYDIEQSHDLATNEWVPVGSVPQQVNGKEGIVRFDVTIETDQAFFRMAHLSEIVSPTSITVDLEPMPGESGWLPDERLRITLSSPLDPGTLGQLDDWIVTDDFGRTTPIEIRYEEGFSEVILEPSLPWRTETNYQIAVAPHVQTQTRMPLSETIGNWTFNTATSPSLVDDQTVYSRDTDDVLRIDVTVIDGETPFTLDDILADRFKGDEFDPEVRVHVTGETYQPTLTGSNATLRVRGATSRVTRQKSFRIQLDDDEENWRGHRRINLNKHPFEVTRVRNRLSFELFEEIPHLNSLRTQFVQLFINEEDFGLFTQIENPDEDFLDRHELDSDGQLYKANFFEWYRYPDALKLQSDPTYSKEAFEQVLEIQAGDDHEKLLQMLDDINNPELDFNQVFRQYFDRDNYLTWLAINLLIGNIDTNSQNFFLYSPSDSQTWYLLPWDYDGAWGWRRQPDQRSNTFPRWQEGLANYWNNPLHRRFMGDPQNRADLEDTMRALQSNHLREERITEVLARYRALIGPFISRAPDNRRLPVTSENNTSDEGRLAEWDGEYDRLPSEIPFNWNLYLSSIERPMPIFLGNPTQTATGISFRWSPSDHLLDREFHYDFAISNSPTFADDTILVQRQESDQVTLELEPTLAPGDYFFRVIVRDNSAPEQHWQIPFGSYFDESTGSAFFGIRPFTIR